MFFASILLGIWIAIPRTIWVGFARIDAVIVGALLRAVGMVPFVHGTVVSAEKFSVRIIDECLGIDLMLLLVAFIVAYPAPNRYRLAALIFGIPTVFAANIVRIIAVFLIACRNRGLFEVAHVYFGQIFMILVLCSFAAAWIVSISGNGRIKAIFSFMLRLAFFSSIFFLLWTLLQHHYVRLTEPALEWVAKIITGMGVRFNEHRSFDYTFNFVTFYALILSTDSIKLYRKIVSLITGSVLLMAVHFIFRTIAVFTAVFHSEFGYGLSKVVYDIGVYLVPVVLWILARYWNRRTEIPECPICGKTKIGIETHIRMVHDETAFARKDVRALLLRIEEQEKSGFC